MGSKSEKPLFETALCRKTTLWSLKNHRPSKKQKPPKAAAIKGFRCVPGAGIEPALPQREQDFKSCVSTSSTTRA